MKKEKNLKITPYLYLVPSILIFAVFLFYPFVKTVYLSLFITNNLFKSLQNKQNGTGKNLCRSSELYRSA